MSHDDLDRPSVEAWGRHLGQTAAPDELRAELSAGTLSAALATTAAGRPDVRALTIDDAHMTHGELDEGAARVAGWLSKTVTPGDVLLVLGASDLDFVVTCLGALRAGAVVLLAAPAMTPHELGHIAGNSGAVAAVGPGRVLAERPELGSIVDKMLAYDDHRALGPPLDPVDLKPDDPALLAYTSGTTGAPKGVVLSHANVLSSIRSVMRAWRWSEDDVLVHCLPLYHQHGLSGVIATLLAGSRAVVEAAFDPVGLASRIHQEHATVLFSVPTIYERLLAAPSVRARQLAGLRLATSGSAPLSPVLRDRIVDLLGLIPLERYGTTESGLDVSNLLDGPRPRGSIGIPLPGVEVRLVDDGGRPVEDGKDGEIVVRGPQVFDGYLGLPDESERAFFPGGWFRTGDIARRAEGFFEITGRSKDLIISGGFNVYPREVEQALETHGAVAEVAVTGVPSDRWGEEVVAFVVLSGPATPEELRAHAAARLTFYKRPKRVVVVDRLPRNSMGKILRGKLAPFL